jgi:uncharacterized protein YecE (DUF72 family)
MADVDRFLFRDLHPGLFLGTASDRYAGWLGQIYTPERYAGRISKRPKTIKGKIFQEAVLPLDSVKEYFQHFSVLEVDYTFYRPLLDEKGRPTSNYFLLEKYAEWMSGEDTLILKVPQAVMARKVFRGPRYENNETYLDPELFTEGFYRPAVQLLGKKLGGFLFEQEYHRKEERRSAAETAEELRRFFSSIPRDDRYHLELRTETYLDPSVFEVMAAFGIGQVLSHWTWLPPLPRQFERSGRRFFNGQGNALIRLMTPLGMRYEDAYEKAFPFDKLVEDMLQPRMIADTVRMIKIGIEQGMRMQVIVNNRSGGNAPLVARRIAEVFAGVS